MKRILVDASSLQVTRAYAKLKARFGDRLLTFELSSAVVADDFTTDEEKQFRDIIAKRDTLDSWEPSKLRNITLAQAEAKVDAITSLADAKPVMKTMVRVLMWLLKREMDELQSAGLDRGSTVAVPEPYVIVKKKSWWRRLLRLKD